MKYRRLGESNLLVSEIALGSWLTYSGGIDAATSRACIHKALSHGINFIDTANIYGRGAAETFLGETLAGVPRDKYILATKLYFPMTDSDSGLSRAQIYKQIDASLARLKTDHVDLYQCHRFDPETPLEETMQALTEVVAAGKALFVGFSEWPKASAPPSKCRAWSASFQASRNIHCFGANPRPKSSRFAKPRGSRKSCGRRWRRVC